MLFKTGNHRTDNIFDIFYTDGSFCLIFQYVLRILMSLFYKWCCFTIKSSSLLYRTKHTIFYWNKLIITYKTKNHQIILLDSYLIRAKRIVILYIFLHFFSQKSTRNQNKWIPSFILANIKREFTSSMNVADYVRAWII